jgi:hypothetical protein
MMKSAASQQYVEGSLGFLTYHQARSALLPTISACRPTGSSLTTLYEIPGPDRQFTGPVLGSASTRVGVSVGVTVAGSKVRSVSMGKGVEDGSALGWVGESGVDVLSIVGKLHAVRIRTTETMIGLAFIHSSFEAES